MDTKIFKKLIAAVCAATMATSCAAMSVGAAPAIILQAEDWAQGYNRAMELNDLVHDVSANGCDFDACSALADELEEFFNGMLCTVAVYGSQSVYKDAFAGNIVYILTNLRSPDLGQRQLGTGAAIDNLHDVAELIEGNMH